MHKGQCEKSYEIKRGGQELALMVQVDGKNFNNNSGEFCADSQQSWDEATQIDLNCCY